MQCKLRIFQKTLWIHAKVIAVFFIIPEINFHGTSIYFILVIIDLSSERILMYSRAVIDRLEMTDCYYHEFRIRLVIY